MDGVVADFSSAFREMEVRLFGPTPPMEPDLPEDEAALEEGASERERRPPPVPGLLEGRRRREAIWDAIHRTPDFWTLLKPLDPAAVPRIHALMLQYGWEVFFITQRPATTGDTVQRQTQRWLRAQGFDMPSVLVISGSRGAAAGALRLDYHVDDHAQHCVDVAAESPAQPILIVPGRDEVTESGARRLRIGIARSIGEALDVLERASARARRTPALLSRLASLVTGR